MSFDLVRLTEASNLTLAPQCLWTVVFAKDIFDELARGEFSEGEVRWAVGEGSGPQYLRVMGLCFATSTRLCSPFCCVLMGW